MGDKGNYEVIQYGTNDYKEHSFESEKLREEHINKLVEIYGKENVSWWPPLVKLSYGDGFTGRYYTLKIDDQFIRLWPPSNHICGGSQEDENTARRIAKRILDKRYDGRLLGIDVMPFEWDGTL